MSSAKTAQAAELDAAARALGVLCNEQTRLMLAQNAATLSRLAAAISHEMNTPLGSLRSAVDTFESTVERARTPADDRVARVQLDLLRSMREAANRLSDVVARMQRFTNLNRAEVQPTCVNGLISDVVGLLDSEVRARVDIDLQLERGLPWVTSHPQQLSAVFSMLIHNAVDSIDGAGRIRIVTRHDHGHVHLEIHDNGRGIPDDLLPEVFEPVFRERSGRVGAANWNLFSCRHVIEAHEGEIHLSSLAGEGTTVHIALPVPTAPNG